MRTLAILTVLLAAAVLPTAALGRDDPGVMKTGRCTNGAGWKLKAKHEDGRIEVEFEVDQNVSGRRWTVVLKRDGSVVFRRVRITRPPSGSFEIVRRIANPPGADRISASARAAAGGACRAALSI
jgi:hypothetical protein